MNYSTLQEVMEPVADEQQIEALSVYRAFEQIEDGRHKRGVRYRSALILTLIVLAKLAGMTSLAGIAEWVRLRADWLNEVLPNPRETFPCAATYSNVVRAVDAKPGAASDERPADASGSHEALWRPRQSRGQSSRAREACACGSGWQNVTRYLRPYGFRSAEDASVGAL
jgi:hypothetical protein